METSYASVKGSMSKEDVGCAYVNMWLLWLIMIFLAWSFRGRARLSLSDNIQILSLRGSDWARALLQPYTYLYVHTHPHTLGYYSVRRKTVVCHLQQHGWALQTLCSLRQVRQKDKYCTISYICEIFKSQTHKHREWNGEYHWLEGGGIGEMLFKGINLQIVIKKSY